MGHTSIWGRRGKWSDTALTAILQRHGTDACRFRAAALTGADPVHARPPMMATLLALLELLRPINLGLTALGVVLGTVLALGGLPDLEASWQAAAVAAVSAVLIAAGGNVLNDVFDIDIDAVNRANRPLPSGLISRSAARMLWATLSVAGVALGAAVSWRHFVLAMAAAALLYGYSARLKRVPVAGNAAISFLVGLAIVYGGLVGASPESALVGAAFAFLSTFAREVIKDVEDVEGDRSAGRRTIPIVYGARAARTVSSAALLLTVVLTPVPYLAMDYGPLFLLLVLAADLVLLRCIWLAPDAPREAAVASAWLKGGMLVGMAALFAA